MVKVGIIVRADLTGLGIQSRNWVRLLDPHKVIIIDSTPFNGNEQHFEWYEGRNSVRINGFIQPSAFEDILDDIDVLLTFEIPYNYELFAEARKKGVKTILQNNWEFTDYLMQPYLPFPDLLVNHSYWNFDYQKSLWPEISHYCPTPLFVEDYDEIMLENMDKDLTKRRFLHIGGRKAHLDRNGIYDLVEAVKLIPKDIDFELVIKAQTADVPEIDDPRIIVDRDSPVDEKELYRGFDAVILPRKYGGASLPMTEALMSGLPVIMTDVAPNNKVLPREWLVPAAPTTSFVARTEIVVFTVNHQALAHKIINFSKAPEEDILAYKIRAREIAIKEYSDESVKEKWALLMEKLGV